MMKAARSPEQELGDLEAQGLRRSLRFMESAQSATVRYDSREVLNFSSNDYLGLANSEELKAACIEGVQRYGAGSGASRLVCGGLEPHRRLEAMLAEFKRSEAALVFSSGFAVPLGVIPALMSAGDVIILDKLCHASLVDAARLSGATLRVFPHNHMAKLERLLAGAAKEARRVLVVTESIFSMDGDAAMLREIVELKERYGAWLLLDEAHAVGVLGPQGRGLAAALGLEQRIELQMGTLSKALGLSGGYIAASRGLIDLLINKARSFIYSTAPPPALAHAACESLQLVQSQAGDERRAQLQAHVQQFTRAMPSARTDSAIVPIIVGGEAQAVHASQQLLAQGFLIPAIRFPTVARGTARLRVTLSASHTQAQVEQVLAALAASSLTSSRSPCPVNCH